MIKLLSLLCVFDWGNKVENLSDHDVHKILLGICLRKKQYCDFFMIYERFTMVEKDIFARYQD